MLSLYNASFRVVLKVNCVLKGQFYNGIIGKRPNLCYIVICYKESTGIFLKFWEGLLGPFRLGKLAWQTPKLGNLL